MNESCLSSPEAALHCGAAWLFKTKMSFYGQELHLPWWFGVGCITYSFSGVVMLLYVPSWLSKSRFPYFSFAYFLIFLQGQSKRRSVVCCRSSHTDTSKCSCTAQRHFMDSITSNDILYRSTIVLG